MYDREQNYLLDLRKCDFLEDQKMKQCFEEKSLTFVNKTK